MTPDTATLPLRLPPPATKHIEHLIFCSKALEQPRKIPKKEQELPHLSPFNLPPVPPRQAQGLDRGILVSAYAQGGSHVRDLCQSLGVTAYKYGLSARRDVGERVIDSRRMRHAEIIADLHAPDTAIYISPYGGEWFLSPFEDTGSDPRVAEALAHIPHAKIDNGTINFRMDPGLSLVALEREFNAVLDSRNFNRFLASEDGARRLVEIGLPRSARLFTDYRLMGAPRRSLVTELICLRPRVELYVVVQAVRAAIERLRARAPGAV